MLKLKSVVSVGLFCLTFGVATYAVADQCFEAQKKYHSANDVADVIRDSLRVDKSELSKMLENKCTIECASTNGTICFSCSDNEVKAEVIKLRDNLVDLQQRSDSLGKQISEALDNISRFCK
ncbi:MAG: hypothetical protein LBJ98_00355 [Endomicrobium sp.]|jgi:hypothetical protein|nr:hypothetical protein [Endomicrobium sp.]